MQTEDTDIEGGPTRLPWRHLLLSAVPVLVCLLSMQVCQLLSTYSVLTEVAGEVAQFWSRRANAGLSPEEIGQLARSVAVGNGVDSGALAVSAAQEPDPALPGLRRAVVQLTLIVGAREPWRLYGRTILDPSLHFTARGVFLVEVRP
jgi:hypothetical protein